MWRRWTDGLAGAYSRHRHGRRAEICAEEAHAVARGSVSVAPLGVDAGDATGLAAGQLVAVTPDDYGRVPVTGRLVGLTVHEVAIQREDAVAGMVTVHFPRLGLRVVAAAAG